MGGVSRVVPKENVLMFPIICPSCVFPLRFSSEAFLLPRRGRGAGHSALLGMEIPRSLTLAVWLGSGGW
jgi:hypothetical protein